MMFEYTHIRRSCLFCRVYWRGGGPGEVLTGNCRESPNKTNNFFEISVLSYDPAN